MWQKYANRDISWFSLHNTPCSKIRHPLVGSMGTQCIIVGDQNKGVFFKGAPEMLRDLSDSMTFAFRLRVCLLGHLQVRSELFHFMFNDNIQTLIWPQYCGLEAQESQTTATITTEATLITQSLWLAAVTISTLTCPWKNSSDLLHVYRNEFNACSWKRSAKSQPCTTRIFQLKYPFSIASHPHTFDALVSVIWVRSLPVCSSAVTDTSWQSSWLSLCKLSCTVRVKIQASQRCGQQWPMKNRWRGSKHGLCEHLRSWKTFHPRRCSRNFVEECTWHPVLKRKSTHNQPTQNMSDALQTQKIAMFYRCR